MTLQQTISKMIGRDVSIEEAKEYANNQFGVFCAYILETEKENKVFICDTSDFSEETGLEIEGYLEGGSWRGHEKKAKAFINHANKTGRAYSLKQFQEAVNQQEEEDLTNSFIFITKNY